MMSKASMFCRVTFLMAFSSKLILDKAPEVFAILHDVSPQIRAYACAVAIKCCPYVRCGSCHELRGREGWRLLSSWSGSSSSLRCILLALVSSCVLLSAPMYACKTLENTSGSRLMFARYCFSCHFIASVFIFLDYVRRLMVDGLEIVAFCMTMFGASRKACQFPPSTCRDLSCSSHCQ